jgi:ribosomal protein S14
VIDQAREAAPPRSADRCQACGAPLAADQEWCLECGAARAALRTAPKLWLGLLIMAAAVAVVAIAAAIAFS